jgi:hypothetical protein
MTTLSEIEVRIEDGSFKRAKAGHPLVDGFRIFQFIRKSPKSGEFVTYSTTGRIKTTGDNTITVLAVSSAGDVKRFVRLAKGYVKNGRPMVAVASPAIFNQPRYRDVIERIHIPGVGVLVEDPSTFDVEQLAPWVCRILDAGKEKRKAAPEKAAVPATAIKLLDVSARLRDPASGRLDATRISNLLGISKSDLATKVCGVSRQTLGQNPTSAGLQEKLQPLEGVAQALIWCGGDEAKLRAWLNRPNRDFPQVGGVTPSPMDLILQGHAPVVARKVGNLRTGHPA